MLPIGIATQFWTAAGAAGVRLVLCGHVHRAGLSWQTGNRRRPERPERRGVGRPNIAWYDVTADDVTMRLEPAAASQNR